MALERLVKKKIERHGELVLEDQEEPGPDYGDNVVSLVDALKKSLSKKAEIVEPKAKAKSAPPAKQKAAAEKVRSPRAAKAPAKRAKK
jgi:non-homologous end joining protein Ku